MEKLELLVSKSINIIEEEYDKVRLDKNASEDWVSFLEILLKCINEDKDDGDTPLGIWTSIVAMLTAEINAYKDDEDIVNRIKNLYFKIAKTADSLGF